jgi:ATP-binding cassette subfamily F protein uup
MERLSVEEDKRKKLIDQELEWVRRSPSARTGKQKARLGRLDALQAEQRRSASPPATAVEMTPARRRGWGAPCWTCTTSPRVRPAARWSATSARMLQAGERIGIIGPNGAGKTTLLR